MMRNSGVVGAIVALVLIGLAFFAITRLNFSPMPNTGTTLSLTSSAFAEGAAIPAKYTCDGDRTLSPPLTIAGVPEATQALVLIMDDPDVPKALSPDGVFDHWVLFNIPPETREIAEGESAGVAGANGAGQNAYTGPCPPPEYEPSEHRYVFTLYALSAPLTLPEGATKQQVLDALRPLVLAQGQLVGRYARE